MDRLRPKESFIHRLYSDRQLVKSSAFDDEVFHRKRPRPLRWPLYTSHACARSIEASGIWITRVLARVKKALRIALCLYPPPLSRGCYCRGWCYSLSPLARTTTPVKVREIGSVRLKTRVGRARVFFDIRSLLAIIVVSRCQVLARWDRYGLWFCLLINIFIYCVCAAIYSRGALVFVGYGFVVAVRDLHAGFKLNRIGIRGK